MVVVYIVVFVVRCAESGQEAPCNDTCMIPVLELLCTWYYSIITVGPLHTAIEYNNSCTWYILVSSTATTALYLVHSNDRYNKYNQSKPLHAQELSMAVCPAARLT